jgi:DUF1009 family protein
MTAPKLGIVAGAGVLPGLLAAACRTDARPFYVLGLSGFADVAQLGQEPDAWLRLGDAGQGFELLRVAGVTEVVMAGAVKRPKLSDLRPDLKTAAFFARIAGRAFGDDGLLRAVIDEIEREGFRVVGADQVLTTLLAPDGVLGFYAPDAAATHDIAVGAAAAHQLGRDDVGQAVVVHEGVVVACEEADGTAALIALCQAPGGVLVKMKKPQQDRRADLPAIGPDTIAQAVAAGLRGVAVEAGGCLVLDLPQVRTAADEAGIFLVGISP